MGDGLKNAKLEALLTRGPWTGGTSHPCDTPWTLEPTELRAYYEAIRAEMSDPAPLTLDCKGSSRKADRANSLLKKTGLIEFDPFSRRWVVE